MTTRIPIDFEDVLPMRAFDKTGKRLADVKNETKQMAIKPVPNYNCRILSLDGKIVYDGAHENAYVPTTPIVPESEGLTYEQKCARISRIIETNPQMPFIADTGRVS